MMEGLFKAVVEISVGASVFAALVLILRLVMGKKPNRLALMLLWGLFMLRLIVPLQIQSPLSLQNIVPQNIAQNSAQNITDPPQADTPLSDNLPQGQVLPVSGAPSPSAAIVSPAAATLPQSAVPQDNRGFWYWASLLWIMGMAVFAVCTAGANIGFFMRLRKKQRYTEKGFLALVLDCRRELGIRKSVEAVRVDEIGTAAVCGVFHPRILICPQAFERLDAQSQRHILMHELMHLKRKDTQIAFVSVVLKAVYWFNPIVWFMLSKMQKDTEILCDASVIRKLKRPLDYAQTLIELAECASNRKKMRLIMAVADKPRELKRRIAAAVEWKRQKPQFTVLAVALVLCAFAVGCTSAVKTDIEVLPAAVSATDSVSDTVAPSVNENTGAAAQNVKIGAYSITEPDKINGSENRLYNIKFALKKLDGQVIGPGETLSFNALIGDRTEANGWKTAPGIVSGVLTGNIGGGVSEASSLLYAASLYADLSILERKPLARPPVYLPAGLEAAVSNGKPDLIIKNNKTAEVSIKTYAEEKDGKTLLTLELYGPQPPDAQTIEIKAKTSKKDGKTIAQVTKEYYQDGKLVKSVPLSEDTYKYMAQTASTGTWREQFADQFTDGAVIKNDTSYKSANISVSVSEKKASDFIYYVADIYIADIKYLKTAFAGEKYGDGQAAHTDAIAVKNNAIIAINGDNSPLSKGPVVRNGVLYADKAVSDLLMMYYDGSMQAYSAKDFDISRLKNEGAWQAWTFGPMLLKDGKPMTAFDSQVTINNPRSAIGYYEPGHYCFVTVDGRQAGYSNGCTMQQLSEIFYGLGCKEAFNLDGGQSSEMAFMGKLVNKPYNGGRTIRDIVCIAEE
jgi:beta-lactamase regulating signal transducer with metallopeptidase domain/exopolysaccharide biosynthesis protein